jgi:hypothetical protein
MHRRGSAKNFQILKDYRTGAVFSVERDGMRHLYRVPLHSLVQVMWSLARLAR